MMPSSNKHFSDREKYGEKLEEGRSPTSPPSSNTNAHKAPTGNNGNATRDTTVYTKRPTTNKTKPSTTNNKQEHSDHQTSTTNNKPTTTNNCHRDQQPPTTIIQRVQQAPPTTTNKKQLRKRETTICKQKTDIAAGSTTLCTNSRLPSNNRLP